MRSQEPTSFSEWLSHTHSTSAADIAIENIVATDLPDVLAMLKELAAYEEVEEPVRSTVESLHEAMFGARPLLYGYIARRWGESAGVILGYDTYTTFGARRRLFVEDLVVRAQHRGAGVGRALLAAFARWCAAQDYGAVHWRVLDRNAPSIRFYASVGAEITFEHRNCALSGEALARLATGPAPANASANCLAAGGQFLPGRSA